MTRRKSDCENGFSEQRKTAPVAVEMRSAGSLPTNPSLDIRSRAMPFGLNSDRSTTSLFDSLISACDQTVHSARGIADDFAFTFVFFELPCPICKEAMPARLRLVVKLAR